MFFWKVFKCVVSLSRLLKCKRRLSLRQFMITIGVLGVISCLISLFLYVLLKKTDSKQETVTDRPKVENTTQSKRPIFMKPMKHIPLSEIYPDDTKEDVDSFEIERKPRPMIDTNGCKIPIALVAYNRTRQKLSCGLRAVFFKKAGKDRIKATIKVRVMKKYLRINGTFECCYKFFAYSKKSKEKHGKIIHTKCKPLNESEPILLKTEFLNVKCFQYNDNTTYVIYKDAYAFVKKLRTPKPNVLNSQCKYKYNVLVIGMDSLSLSRVEQTMTRTTKHLKDNYWLGYRAFNKIEGDAFPNLIAALTGLDMTDFTYKCGKNMSECNQLLVWSKFKEGGYVTAYGEDYLSLPEMFSKSYRFDKKPTDHYPRTLFENDEYLVNGSLVCTGTQTSGEQLLNYALDFALTYRTEAFFGVFWIHSLSHSVHSPLVEVDQKVENFLNQLIYTGVLRNTFVILMSAHGILVGDTRLNPSSFYDERMPMLFVLPASRFKGQHLKMYESIALNEGKLITPFDVYKTLVTIKQVSLCENSTVVSESCPKCQSLTELIDNNRTCKDAAIHEKWCSCRKLYTIDVQNDYGVKSILHVVAYMQSVIKSIKTQPCWTCSSLTLKRVIRMHFYYDETNTNLHYVVAFSMTPGDMVYEATILQKGVKFDVIGPVTLLSDIKGFGNCTLYQYTRSFCLCTKTTDC